MHKLQYQSLLASKAFAIMLVLSVFSSGEQAARAAVTGTGDVLPQQTFVDVEFGVDQLGNPILADVTAPSLPFFGGRLTNVVDDGSGGQTTELTDLIVGGTGVFSGTTLKDDGTQIGTTFGTVTINSPTNTLPLIANEIHIGRSRDGRGRISLTDFGSTLIALEDELWVGEEGDGELRILNGAVVGVGEPNPTDGGSEFDFEDFAYEDGATIIGAERLDTGTPGTSFMSQGVVLIDGFGSRLISEGLVVAREGIGTVEISNQGHMRTRTSTIGSVAGSLGRVSVTGQFSEWDNAETITIGAAGTGTLEVGDQGHVIAESIIVGATAPDNLAGASIDLTGGTITSRLPIVNNDTIRGDGFINANLLINQDGVLSNSAAEVQTSPLINQPREFLQVSGTVDNLAGGLIQSEGGEMKFDSLVTNFGDILGREAILRFNASPPEDSTTDLINSGTIIVGGDTTITGDILNSSGQIVTLEDTFVLLQGNLSMTSGILTIISGDEPAPITVTGDADLRGAAIDLSLTTTVGPDDGPFELLQALGSLTAPTFPFTTFNGEIYDLLVIGDTLVADPTGMAAIPVGADFNGDGIVNALDLQIWEDNWPIASGATKPMGDADGDGDVDSADFFKIQRDFGIIPPPPIVGSATVPEPSTLAMALLTIVCCPRRRVRA